MIRRLSLSVAALLVAMSGGTPYLAATVQDPGPTFSNPLEFLAAVVLSELAPDVPSVLGSQLRPAIAAPHGVPPAGDLGHLGPAGGAGGAPFYDVCDPAGVVVRSGWWIDAVQLVCRDGGYGPHRGGYGGGEHVFYLEPGERILGIQGTHHGEAGGYLYSLQLITDRRLSPVYGNGGPIGRRGYYAFRFDVPPGADFVGFHGRAGSFVDALGIVFRERYGPRYRPPPPTPLYPHYGAEVDNACRDFRETLTRRFEWTEVPGASRYHLHARRVGSRNPAIDLAHLREPFFYEEARGSYVAPHLLTGWEWRVRALVNGAWTDWSEPQPFHHEPLDTDCPRYGAAYRIGLATGLDLGAGTDSRIYLKLRGTLGESGWLPLDGLSARDPFEAGACDYVTLELPTDLGEIYSVSLWNDGSGPLADWRLMWVSVGRLGYTPRTFHVNRWVAPGTSTGWIG